MVSNDLMKATCTNQPGATSETGLTYQTGVQLAHSIWIGEVRLAWLATL